MKGIPSAQILKMTCLALLFLFVNSCREDQSLEEKLIRVPDRSFSLIPQPNTIRVYKGRMPLFPRICAEEVPDSLQPAFDIFIKDYRIQVSKWRRVYKKFFDDIPHLKDTCLELQFVRDTALASEAYKLKLRGGVQIHFNSKSGAFYALRTLDQLVFFDMNDGKGGYFYLPWMDIEDAPRFSYRGTHLDVVRHFMELRDIRRFVDVLSFYKINTLHLHLTDDQGWRMEIKRYPKLHTIASKRKETLIGKPSKHERYDHKPHGGYYSQDALKQLVKYAADRQIQIIPEIEIPGHSRALLAAYPKLSCTGKRLPVATKWGVFNEVMCPKPETFEFLKGVLDEVMEVFPSKFIHIGGDECPTISWENSTFCQELMEEKGMKTAREIEGYFIHEIGNYLQSKGRTIIGWDEILDSPVPSDAIVMAWRGVNRGIKAAQMGHRTIMTPGAYCYLDHYQSLLDKEPLAIGGYTPLDKVYSFDPAPDTLPPSIKSKFIGLQGNIWTEYLKDFDAVSYMAFPRILAIAEVGWTRNENKDYSHFVRSLISHLRYLRLKGMKYSEAFKIPSYTTFNKQGYTYVELHTPFKEGRLKYWANRENSERLGETYKAPIVLTDSMYIRFRYFGMDRDASEETKLDIVEHAATGEHLTMQTNPLIGYKLSDPDYLINGIVGKPRKWSYNQEWLEMDTSGFIGTIDLQDTLSHTMIQWHFGDDPKYRILPPKSVKVSIGNHLDSLKEVRIKYHIKHRSKQVIYTINLPKTPYRFLKLEARPPRMPNKKARLFSGEIEVGWR